MPKNPPPRTCGRWASWPFSVITYFQLNYEFVLESTTENTGSQIIPLEELGQLTSNHSIIRSWHWSLMSHSSITDLPTLDKDKQLLPPHCKDRGKRNQEVWWFFLVQILPEWQKQQSYLTSSSIVSFVHLQKLHHPFSFSIQFCHDFSLKKKHHICTLQIAGISQLQLEVKRPNCRNVGWTAWGQRFSRDFVCSKITKLVFLLSHTWLWEPCRQGDNTSFRLDSSLGIFLHINR